MINDIFRFDEAVPTPYVINSRDMQMLLRLFTYGLNPAKYSAEQIQYINNAELCNDRILSLLAEKVQFMDSENIKSDMLRLIVQNFAGLVRGKGTKKSIEEAVYLYLMAYKIHAKTLVYLEEDSHIVQVGINAATIDIYVLEKMLKYLIPTGWMVSIFFYEDVSSRMAFKFKNTLCRIKETGVYSNTMYVVEKDGDKLKSFVYPSMETIEMEPVTDNYSEIANVGDIKIYDPIYHE